MKINKKYVGPSYEEDLQNKLNNPEFAEYFKQEQIKYEIAQMVIKARKHAGLTQAKLSELTGLKQSAIARIESRNSKMIPSIEILRKIFLPLGYNVSFNVHKLKKAA
jgi:ribosome-binding protein aMBF1 (putative translation factor)